MTTVSQAKPFEAYRGDAPYVFVSYSHRDREAAYIELVRLKKLGFNVWYDEGLSPGSRWSDELAERIANCALFIYFVTSQSVTSTNCQDEAAFVLEAGNPFLAVHLEETELPPGLKLRMGPRQAILRYELEPGTYQNKLYAAIAAQSAELVSATVDFTHGFRLGDYTIEPLTGAVMEPDGKARHLEPKVMDVFVCLAEQANELVTRDQLLDAVWSGQVAADELLTRAISELRRVLQKGGNDKCIETVPKRGYRLIGDVQLPEVARPEEKLQVAIAHPASAITSEDIETAEAQSDRPWRRPGTIGLAALLTALTAAIAWELVPVPAPPVVSDYTQLTTSQIIFPPTQTPVPLVADASRIYFNAWDSGRLNVRQLSQGGGEATGVEVPLEDEDQLVFPLAMTPEGSQLLVGAFSPYSDEMQSLWAWPVVGGNPRRLGEGADPAYSPDGSKLLYSNGNDEIYLADPDLGDPRLLATAPGKVHWLRFSPDGRRIRFTVDAKSQALFEMAADGTGLHRVFPDWGFVRHCCGSWTPDGKHFVFHAVHNDRTQIWAIRERQGILGRRRSEPVQITGSALDFRRPTIAPQGDRIFSIGWQLRGELVRYDNVSERFVPMPGFESVSAEWLTYHRDEEWIAYVSYPEGSLWRSKTDGTDRRQLTFPPLRVGDPEWSPDGRNIAFSGRLPGGQDWNIYIVSAEGGRPRAVTSEDRRALVPTWSPDGRSLAFTAAGADRIQILELATGTVSDLEGSDGLFYPSWSPDGRFLAASSKDHLQLFDFSTGRSEKLVKAKTIGVHYWTRDSQYLYYADPFFRGSDRAVYRINIRDKTTEKIVTVGDTRAVSGVVDQWIGVTPDGAPMLLRDLSIHHIYALDWPPD